jgi:hypothetical protein
VTSGAAAQVTLSPAWSAITEHVPVPLFIV